MGEQPNSRTIEVLFAYEAFIRNTILVQSLIRPRVRPAAARDPSSGCAPAFFSLIFARRRENQRKSARKTLLHRFSAECATISENVSRAHADERSRAATEYNQH